MDGLQLQKKQEVVAIALEVKDVVRTYGHSSKAPPYALQRIQKLISRLQHCVSLLQAFETSPFHRSLLDYVSGTYARVIALPIPRQSTEDVLSSITPASGELNGADGRGGGSDNGPAGATAFPSSVYPLDAPKESGVEPMTSPSHTRRRRASKHPESRSAETRTSSVPQADTEVGEVGEIADDPFQHSSRHPGVQPVRWSDVSGCTEAINALKQAVVLPHTHPNLFSASRRPWRTILLYGPPGTGKTTLAAAAAAEADAVFLSVSAADLLSKWIGESEKLVRRLFQSASIHERCIIFLDEVDALGGMRGSATETEASRRLKTELLLNMLSLGVSPLEPHSLAKENLPRRMTTLIAATNLPWELDPAFRRRFDRHVYVGLPEMAAREQLIQRHLDGVDHSLSQSDMNSLAIEMDGYSACDVIRVVHHAVLQPVTELLTATHFRPIYEGHSQSDEGHARNEEISGIAAVAPTNGNPSKYAASPRCGQAESAVKAEAEGRIWIPCEPTHPSAVALTMSDLPSNSLRLPCVSADHFRDSLISSPPTTSVEMVRKYTKWESSLRE